MGDRTWRLSRIQEELEELDFPPPPPPITNTHSLDRRRSKGTGGGSPGVVAHTQAGPHGGSLRLRTDPSFKPALPPNELDQGIYDKVVIKPAYNRKPTAEEEAKEAVRRITEKYDSLGRHGMGLLKAYTESQQVRSRSYDSMLDDPAISEQDFSSHIGITRAEVHYPAGNRREFEHNVEYPPPQPVQMNGTPAVNDELLSAGGYRRDTVAEASVGADPSFPPPPTQDELTNASGIVTKSSLAPNVSAVHRPAQDRSPVPVPAPSRPHSARSSTPSAPIFPQVRPSSARAAPVAAASSPAPVRPGGAPSSLRLGEMSEGGVLTEAEVLQVEMFYRSHKTEVWVSQCTAHLHLGSVKITTSITPKLSDKKIKHSQQAAQPRISSELVENWKYVKMGVPVFLLDTGATRNRDRKMYIILAEKGTGFTLWRDKLDHLSAYRASTAVFHTLHLSGDHNNMAGLSFDDAHAATEFLARWRAIVSNPKDDILNLSGKNKKRKKDENKKQKGKFKAPSKSAISTPCCFTHVTKLDRTDGMNILGTKGPRGPATARELQQLSSPVSMSPRVAYLIPQDAHNS